VAAHRVEGGGGIRRFAHHEEALGFERQTDGEAHDGMVVGHDDAHLASTVVRHILSCATSGVALLPAGRYPPVG
jgi:hypothetical protein